MRHVLVSFALMGGLMAGCSLENGADPQRQAVAGGKGSVIASARLDRTAVAGRAPSSFASLPDGGRLLAKDGSRRPVKSGASTWHPVQVSEEHALRAIAAGGMTIESPDGKAIALRYVRHIEHEDGNWTWIGRPEGATAGSEAVLTFGEKSAFGMIPRQGNEPLRLTVEAGKAWLVETDREQLLRSGASSVAFSEDDFLIPDTMPHRVAAAALAPKKKTAGAVAVEQVADMPKSASPAWTPTTVDVALGYTVGFRDRLGGTSQAVTRLNFLVDLANQAYLASGVNAQIRIVRTVAVNYPDALANRSALFDLTGVNCSTNAAGSRFLPESRLNCTFVGYDAALQPLISARDTYGADLVALVRKFEDPEQGSCGTAWLLGGAQGTLDASSAGFGAAVVSDSSGAQFPDNGNTCREESLAHELGHNMGQQHDIVTARGTDDSNGDGDLLDPEEFGRHPYSFSHSTDGGTSNFYTIMSVRRPGQAGYRVFASPELQSCGNAPCGVADEADNVRSLNATMPVVANFRATVVEFWDVSSEHWAFDSIRRIANAGITGGCATNPPMYCPGSQVTRDQMAVFLLRGKHGSDYSPPVVVTSRFADVPVDHWAKAWIEQFAEEGFTTGCATNPLRFCPSAAISREQMAVFLLRARYGADFVPPPATGVFADVPASYWAAPWIEKLAADGITGGCSTSPKAYCPRNTVTRDQMAVFLARTFEL